MIKTNGRTVSCKCVLLMKKKLLVILNFDPDKMPRSNNMYKMYPVQGNCILYRSSVQNHSRTCDVGISFPAAHI